ncbi:hypothetical protein KM043_004473 [Ampulex compressa]|nr:hypothetical protein KM043_004473 [Ampulex compressa]
MIDEFEEQEFFDGGRKDAKYQSADPEDHSTSPRRDYEDELHGRGSQRYFRLVEESGVRINHANHVSTSVLSSGSVTRSSLEDGAGFCFLDEAMELAPRAGRNVESKATP